MHKGSQFQLQEELKEETEVVRTAVDIVLDNLKKSSMLKCNASYMTTVGETKGTLIITPFYLIFDPDFTSGNKKLIRVILQISIECFRYNEVPMFYRCKGYGRVLFDSATKS